MDYGFTHNGKVFTPNQTEGIDPVDSDARNKAIEAAELEVWKTRPERMLAYYRIEKDDRPGTHDTHGVVTTWLGTTIGYIGRYRIYRHNFGGRMISLTVRGTNGAVYYGRASYDWANCVNLRRIK